MSTSNSSGIAAILKNLVIALLRVVAITLSFCCRIASVLLLNISLMLDKFSGHGSNH